MATGIGEPATVQLPASELVDGEDTDQPKSKLGLLLVSV